MEKTFRDILADLMESEDLQEERSESPKLHAAPATDLSQVFEPFWQPEPTAIRSHASRNRYRNVPRSETPATPTRPAASLQPKAEPPPENRIPLSSLPAPERECVTKLIQLGAVNLKQGLSARTLKKAHRLLARKFHPDHLPATAAPAQVRQASSDFMSVQEAYCHLHDYLDQLEKGAEKLSA